MLTLLMELSQFIIVNEKDFSYSPSSSNLTRQKSAQNDLRLPRQLYNLQYSPSNYGSFNLILYIPLSL